VNLHAAMVRQGQWLVAWLSLRTLKRRTEVLRVSGH
jgi:hypothetical protein